MLKSPKMRMFTGVIALLWLAAMISLYYVSHKPFDPQTAFGIAAIIGRLAVSAAIVTICGGTGARIYKAEGQHTLTALALQAGLGLGFLSLGVMGTGLLLGFGVWQLWAFTLILIIIFRRSILQWLAGWGQIAECWRGRGWLARGLACGTGLILLVTLGMALAPPVKFDALVYHLALPRYYLETGTIHPWPGAWFWGMPQTGEMLFTWAAALAGERAAACVGWLIGVVALVGIWGTCFDSLGRRQAWVATAALLSGLTLSTGLANAYIDWLAILFGISGVALLAEWARNNRHEDLIWLGIFCGMAIGTKYSAGVLLLAAAGVVAWVDWKGRKPPASLIQDLLRISLPAALIVSPWLVKNALLTGNPFYPFLLPSGPVEAFRLDFYQLTPGGDWRAVIFLPFKATLSGIEGTPGYSATISALLLALAPLVALAWNRFTPLQRSVLGTAAGAAGLGLCVWAVASRLSGLLVQSRLYFVIFPSLAILAGGGFLALEKLKIPGIRLTRVGGILVLLVFYLAAFQVTATSVKMGVLPELFGEITPQEYLDQNLGWYAPALRGLENLEAGDRVLFLWEPRGFSCLPGCIPDEILDRWITDRHLLGEPAAILQSWRAAGVSHILYNRFGAEFIRSQDKRYTQQDWQALESILSQMQMVEDFGGAYLLYRIRP